MTDATSISEPKPTPQEERTAQLRKAMDALVLARAELYKAELMLRACENCMAHNKEAVK